MNGALIFHFKNLQMGTVFQDFIFHKYTSTHGWFRWLINGGGKVNSRKIITVLHHIVLRETADRRNLHEGKVMEEGWGNRREYGGRSGGGENKEGRCPPR